MLSHQETLSFSKYSELYDMLVPKDNILRKIYDLVDFTFVYQELSSKYCSSNGRMAYSPIRMFQYYCFLWRIQMPQTMIFLM